MKKSQLLSLLLFFATSISHSISFAAEWNYQVSIDRMTNTRTVHGASISDERNEYLLEGNMEYMLRADEERRLRITVGGDVICTERQLCKVLTKFDSAEAIEMDYLADTIIKDYAVLIPINQGLFLKKLQGSRVLLLRPNWGRGIRSDEIVEYKFNQPLDLRKLR